MDYRMKNVLIVIISSVFNVVVSMGVGLLLPKILSVEDYAEYRIYTFYVSFLAMFHFGLSDAILIKFKKFSKEDVIESNINESIMIHMFLNILVCVSLVLLCSLLKLDKVYIYIALSILPVSTSTIFFTMLRVNTKFKIVSFFEVLKKFLLLISVFCLYLGVFLGYEELVLTIIFSYSAVLLFGMFYYKKMFLKKTYTKVSIRNYKLNIKSGLLMMSTAYLLNLSMGLDKIFIQFSKDRTDYAIYSFAISFIFIFITILSSVNGMITPYLARMDNNIQMKSYNILSDIINLSFLVLSIGLPLIPFFINGYLPEYSKSIIIFIFLFPVVLFRVNYSIKHYQYFILFNDTIKSFIFSIILFVLMLNLNLIVLFSNNSLEYYAIFSIAGFSMWNLCLELYFNKKYKFNNKNTIVLNGMFLAAIFLLSINYSDYYIIFVYYIIIFCMFVLWYNKKITKMIKAILKKEYKELFKIFM